MEPLSQATPQGTKQENGGHCRQYAVGQGAQAETTLNNSVNCGTIDVRTHALLLALRQCLIMALGAVEDYMGMERSIVPKHRRAA